MVDFARERAVHVLWCDDIRHEVGNKPSFMGVYTAALVMPTLPSILPRLSLYVSSRTPVERPFRKLVINVRTGAQEDAEPPFARMELPFDGAQPEPQVPLGEDRSKMFLVADAALLLGQIELTEQTKWLKVFVETEDETLESFKLHILQAEKSPDSLSGSGVQ